MENKINEIIEVLGTKGIEATTHKVVKNGIEKTAIVVGGANETIRPTIYIDEMLKELTVKEIAMAIMEQLPKEMPEFNYEYFYKPDFIKEHVVMCVQKKSTEDIVKRDCLDLEAYLRVMISENSSFKVNQALLDKAGISVDRAFEVAEKNTRNNVVVNDMREMLKAMGINVDQFGDSSDMNQVVITNKNNCYGASCLCFTDIFAKIAEAHNSNIVVLPSSIHEVIVHFVKNANEVEQFDAMVKEVNETQVAPEEQLVNHAYYYDVANGAFIY